MRYSLFFLFVFFNSLIFAQRNESIQPEAPKYPAFEGTINYQASFAGKDAKSFSAQEPCTKMDQHFRQGDFIISLYGGNFPTTMLWVADSNRTYIVDAANERAFKKDIYKYSKKDTIPTAIPLNDSLKILNEWCYGYKVEKKNETITYYVSDKYRVDLKYFKKKKNAKANFLTKGLDGRIPLKTIIKTQNLTTTNIAVKIIPRKLAVEEFRLPKKYKILQRDFRR